MAGTDSGFEYEDNLDGLCERVIYILGDSEKGYPNQTWEKAFLKAIACDALYMLAELKPTLFKSERVTLDLEPNTAKQVVECEKCEKVLDFLCFITEEGHTIPAVETDYAKIERAALLPAPCVNCRGGVMDRVPSMQVAMSGSSNEVFAINPMFPDTESLKVVVSCRNLTPYITGVTDLPKAVRAQFPTLIQLILYLALAGDRVAGGHAELANQHFQNFTQSVGLTFQQAEFLRRQMESS